MKNNLSNSRFNSQDKSLSSRYAVTNREKFLELKRLQEQLNHESAVYKREII